MHGRHPCIPHLTGHATLCSMRISTSSQAPESVPIQSNKSSCACRVEAEYADLQVNTKEDRVKAAEATAENRVLIATVRAMQEECHTFKVGLLQHDFPLQENKLSSKAVK